MKYFAFTENDDDNGFDSKAMVVVMSAADNVVAENDGGWANRDDLDIIFDMWMTIETAYYNDFPIAIQEWKDTLEDAVKSVIPKIFTKLQDHAPEFN